MHARKAFAVFLALTVIFVFAYQTVLVQTPRPVADALRYIDYAMNLYEQGTFGLAKKNNPGKVQPGNENTPLLPMLITAAMYLDVGLYHDLTCIVAANPPPPCTLKANVFVWAQCLLVVLALGCIWLTIWVLTQSTVMSWAGAIIALLSGRYFYYANLFLTETLVLFLFSALTLILALLMKSVKTRWMLLLGVVIGLLTLTRPEYHYLFLAVIGVALVALLIKRKMIWLRYAVVILLSYSAVVGPWLIRNYLQFDKFELTQTYASAVLAQRVAYNQMSWTEWGVAFVYWFPDIGDSLSKRLFPREYYRKLGFESESYYNQGSKQVIRKAHKEANTPDEVIEYLLKKELFGNLAKHILVTIPLAWRGLFVAKYWGVLGVLCFVFVLCRTNNPLYRQVVFLSAPAWYLELLHAFISVNVPRYNLILIPIYTLSILLVFDVWYDRLSRRPEQRPLI